MPSLLDARVNGIFHFVYRLLVLWRSGDGLEQALQIHVKKTK